MTTDLDGTSNHFCQFHHDEEDLSEGLARYVQAGLHRGSAVVAVTTSDRALSIRERLVASGSNASTVDRLLTVIDSRALLAEFMHEGWPDRAQFLDTLRPILDTATAAGKGAPCVFGEMVNDLWRDGNPEAAVALEELWNEILTEYNCSLFCGYVLDAFDPESYSAHLEGVCTSHGEIAPAADEARVRVAIDDACQKVLGIHLSAILSHSRLARDQWHARLPLSRRAMLWLKSNTPSRFLQVLSAARDAYEKGAATQSEYQY